MVCEKREQHSDSHDKIICSGHDRKQLPIPPPCPRVLTEVLLVDFILPVKESCGVDKEAVRRVADVNEGEECVGEQSGWQEDMSCEGDGDEFSGYQAALGMSGLGESGYECLASLICFCLWLSCALESCFFVWHGDVDQIWHLGAVQSEV